MSRRLSEAQRAVLDAMAVAAEPWMTHDKIRQGVRANGGKGESPTAPLQALEREGLVERDKTPGSWFAGRFRITDVGRVTRMNLVR